MGLFERLGSVGFKGPWFANYASEFKHANSSAAALRHTINFYRRRKPFDALTDTDTERLVALFAPLPDPRLLADAFWEAERAKDSSLLQDEDRMAGFAAYCAAPGAS
jgi:hypothetical protein